ncbi:MAG: hypothetical protein B7C24_13015 [Bacteroidetes bacterium 4572_77]|nr:MAG: hypothetical protein B7C24_13015 [Bacteroidetes bacterium 4572_77]
MRKLFIFIFLFSLVSIYGQNKLRINEVCSSNTNNILDEDNDNEDWLELYNGDTLAINLSDFYLSDDENQAFKWQLPDMELGSKEYLLIYASGKDRTQIINHWETAAFGDSLWRYKNPSEESLEEHLNWNQCHYNDELWLDSLGGFGVGYENINTETSHELHSIFLRKTFYISDTSLILSAILHAYYDDGFIVYLNGYEILRINMYHDGFKPPFNKSAFRSHHSNIDGNQPPEAFPIDPHLWKTLLKNGKNVLAIQNHNFWNNYPLVIKPWLSFGMADTLKQFDTIAENLPTTKLPLHCNFKISSKGEDLFLNNHLGYHLQEIEIPKLVSDISYGYHLEYEDSLVYFSLPTPNMPNTSEATNGIIQDSIVLLFPSGNYSDPRDTCPIYVEPFYVDSTMVIRMAYHHDTLIQGPICNFTYFINDSSKLEKFSLITDPHNLWDNDYGIYVYGYYYYPNWPYFEANFWQRWERPVHIQQFTKAHEFLWQQDAGIKIHGNYTRSFEQKSFGLYAKTEYGNKHFDDLVIPHKAYLRNTKRFLLRNGGNDWEQAHLRDLLIHRRMKDCDLEIQSGKPVAAYLNGQYWGVYHLREKIDRFYLVENCGVQTQELNLLEQNGLIIDGERQSFEELIQFVKDHDLSQETNYQHIEQEIDIYNWINNFVSNFYHMNTDWPQNNTKFWNTPNRKWRQILVDQDVTMNYRTENMIHKNPISRIHEDSLSYVAIIYKEIIKNKSFRRQFINRFSDLMNTIFLPQEYLPLLDSLMAEMDPEMEDHCQRWDKSYNTWQGYYTNKIRDYINGRLPYMRGFLRDAYEIGHNDTITISHFPDKKGYIKLNTIAISQQNWSGIYYDSIAISLEAIPNPGYEFVAWQSPTSPQLADSGRIIESWFLKDHDSISAIFYSESGQEDTLQLKICEINYRSFDNAEAGDWVEILNSENDTIDLSGFFLTGEKQYKKWQIPSGVKIPPHGRLVFVEDSLLFHKFHPDIPVIGSYGFGWQAETECISLFDNLNRLITKLNFTEDSPWPNNSETSKTIELLNDDLDEQNPENWQLGCSGGSPGLAPQDCHKEIDITITEINYKSAENYDMGDWVELRNNESETLNLSQWIFRDSKNSNTFVFPDSTYLRPEQMLVLAQDTHQFIQFHPKEKTIFGPFWFGLSSSGESISLSNEFDQQIIEINYSSEEPWPDNASGSGLTIELSDFSAPPNQGKNWINSCFLGTPWHEPNWCVEANSILISEIKYQSAPGEETSDWIELYNTNNHQVNLKDWSVVFQTDTLKIADNYFIEPNDFAVLIADSLAFTSFYDTISKFIVVDSFNLQKEEGYLLVLNNHQQPGNILSYHHLLNWPVFQTDTNNRSLELFDYSNTLLAENWRCGCDYGTPALAHTYCNTDGLREHGENNYLSQVHPNPTSNNIYLEVYIPEPEKITYQIFDSQSRIIKQESMDITISGHYKFQLTLEGHKTGLYLLRITGEKGSDYQKILKTE